MPTLLERAVLVAAATSAVMTLAGVPTGATAVALAVAAIGSAVRLMTNHARWQMAPVYLAIACLAVSLVTDASGAARIAIGTIALLLLVVAAILTVGFPIPRLPRPDGPFGVGAITTAEERLTGTGSPEVRRRLFVTVWYPTEPGRGRPKGEALWSEFREAPGIPGLLRILAGYLREVRTHTIRDGRFSQTAKAAPVVLYHHGLVSISAENSLLMESLASHGYVVVSARHVDQRAELSEVNAGADPVDAARGNEITRRLLDELTRAERARLSHELYLLSAPTATIVARRAADSRHVLDRLPAILAKIPGYPADRLAYAQSAGAVGLSLGGAVASELSKIDDRCVAVVNIDGGLYGEHVQKPLAVPCLMICSEHNAGGNDVARDAARAEFNDATVPGTKHLDFHDAVAVLPILRWLGQLGTVPAAEIISWKNQQIRQFLDRTARPR